MEKVEIMDGWFNKAGIIYNWVKDGYDRRGVGIDARVLGKHNILEISIEGHEYTLETKPAIQFVKTYHSYHRAKSTLLGVVSKSLLTEIVKEKPLVQRPLFYVET